MLRDYERAMRPRAVAAQRLIPGRVGMVAPKGRIGIRLNALVMRVIQWRVLLPLIARTAGDRGHATERAAESAPTPR